MKVKVDKAKEFVLGHLELDLKAVSAVIEYKWFTNSNQLNFSLVSIRYKMKDVKVRRMHSNDHMRRKVQESMIRKLQTQGALAILCRERDSFKELKIVWWEH